MKRFLVLFLIIIVAVMGVACQETTEEDDINPEKPLVLTTMYVTYDFAKEVAGDLVNVKLIVPPGSEVHSYEPTPQDLELMNEADMIIYTGDEMEPWMHEIMGTLENDVYIVDASVGVDMIGGEEHEHETHDHEGHDHHHVYDPHIWTSPLNAKIMVDHIADGLVDIDGENAATYESNRDIYQDKLDELWDQFETMRSTANRDFIVFSGHFAMNYLLRDLNLDYIATTDSLGHEAEPNPQALANIIDIVEDEGLSYIYEEELSDGKLSQTIAQETGTEVLKLHGIHNVTKDEYEEGISYITLQEENIENLKEGLE